MSVTFRLRYLLGLIPSAKKIDSDWANLLKMKEKLESIENSQELSRYNELSSLIQSAEFQLQKKEIIDLRYEGSPESQNINEMNNLEGSKSIKGYFAVLKSPQLERFQRIAESKELHRYQELKEVVESSEFQLRKKEMENLRYKGSPECQKREEFNSLNSSRKLKIYYKTLESPDYLLFKELDNFKKREALEKAETNKNKDPQLIIYRKFLESGKYANLKLIEEKGLARQLELLKQEVNAKSFIEKEAFLKDAKRYESSADYPVYKEYSGLAKNDDILFYYKFKNSEGFVNYERTGSSSDLVRLKELQQITAGEEFIKRVAYLKDKKRYQASEHFKNENEFKALDKSEIMKEYRILKKSEKLDFFNQWSVVFDEDFSENNLNTQRWQHENYWGYKMTGRSFSQANELQCYNGPNNLVVNNNVLSILTKKEKVSGQVWNVSAGLMPKEFDYSSGIINSGENFRIKKGVVETKVKFNAAAPITSAFSLTGSMPMPQIDVFRSGKNCVALGITEQTSTGVSRKYKQIHGLNFNQFHVFRLELIDHSLVWKINGFKVHEEHFAHSDAGLFLNFVSSIHEHVNGSAIPHRFEIDWVRCYQMNNN